MTTESWQAFIRRNFSDKLVRKTENSKMSSKSSVDNSGIKYDKDGFPLDNPSLKGLSRYLNNSTIRGRANVSKATFAGLVAYYLYKKFQGSDDSKKIETTRGLTQSDAKCYGEA